MPIGFQVVQQALGLLRIKPLGGQRGGNSLLGHADLLVTRLLDLLLIRLRDAGATQGVDSGGEGLFLVGLFG
jgi:hypothetical protein